MSDDKKVNEQVLKLKATLGFMYLTLLAVSVFHIVLLTLLINFLTALAITLALGGIVGYTLKRIFTLKRAIVMVNSLRILAKALKMKDEEKKK
jgi:hypothetical protein